MNEQIAGFVISRYEIVQNEFIESLGKLLTYNKSDSPAFSQAGSLLGSLYCYMKSSGNDEFLLQLKRLLKHPVQILNDKSLTSEDWDGAPLEVVEECRRSWKRFKGMMEHLL